MRKPKLREQIASLTSRLEEMEKIKDDYKAVIESLKKELWDIDSYAHGKEEILGEVRAIKSRVLLEGQRESDALMHLDRENSRLWYLVRSLTKDETLKGSPVSEESNYINLPEMVYTPFKKPRF